MVDVFVRVGEPPTSFIRIGRKIRLHVFVDFLLKVNPHGAINANDFVGAHSGVGRNIAVGVRNANIRGIVANNVLRALDSGGDNPLYEGGWTVRCLKEVESNEKCDRNVESHRSSGGEPAYRRSTVAQAYSGTKQSFNPSRRPNLQIIVLLPGLGGRAVT